MQLPELLTLIKADAKILRKAGNACFLRGFSYALVVIFIFENKGFRK